ncbi:MAG: hypothetical protein KDD11_14865 [Acidobacteria bacterium]|nr:hypothetical protein [Acidobacteriota bacterium]
MQIIRWLDDHQPGWVECSFRDLHGVEHRFREKAPVVSGSALDAGSAYPQPGLLGCVVLERTPGDDGRTVVSVDTERPWGIESVEGRTRFEVAPEDLVEVARSTG